MLGGLNRAPREEGGMKTRVFAVCVVIFLFCGVACADSSKLVNPANGHSYQRFDTGMSWTSAKTACANLGGHLATITSQAENDWIWTNLGASGSIWLGGTDSAVEGTWTWITGEPWNYSNWGSGQPDNSRGDQNYLDFWDGALGKWDDDRDSTSHSFVCEWDGICADITVKPHTFTAGTPAKATEVNADFDTLHKNDINLNCQIQALKAIVCQDHPTAGVCQ